MQPLRLAVVATTLALFTSQNAVQVNAHSHIRNPWPAFPPGLPRPDIYYADIDIKIFEAKLKTRFRHEEGVQNIEKSMKFENATSLRQFAYDYAHLIPRDGTVNGTAVHLTPTRECGFTVTTGLRRKMPDKVKFPWYHPGPCEIWCDNTLLASGKDCSKNPNKDDYPVDVSKCAHASLVQATFVAVHSHHWQIFTDCVPLEGGTETDPVKVFNYRRGNENGKDGDVTGAPSTTPSTTAPASMNPTRTPSTTTSPSKPVDPSSEIGEDDDATGKPSTDPSTSPPASLKPTSVLSTPTPSPVAPTAAPSTPMPSSKRPSKISKCDASHD